jgi:hypothetical protein
MTLFDASETYEATDQIFLVLTMICPRCPDAPAESGDRSFGSVGRALQCGANGGEPMTGNAMLLPRERCYDSFIVDPSPP